MTTKPFVTTSPQNFKLRLVWVMGGNKMVAEFSNSNWLPRIGETLVLPTDEADKSNSCRSWGTFKVADIIYDFRDQVVRVLCKLTFPVRQPSTQELVAKINQPQTSWEHWEKAFDRVSQSHSEFNEKNIAEELESLRRCLDDL